jgi:hypothetical protein
MDGISQNNYNVEVTKCFLVKWRERQDDSIVLKKLACLRLESF